MFVLPYVVYTRWEFNFASGYVLNILYIGDCWWHNRRISHRRSLYEAMLLHGIAVTTIHLSLLQSEKAQAWVQLEK